jgi:hypothetical protein
MLGAARRQLGSGPMLGQVLRRLRPAAAASAEATRGFSAGAKEISVREALNSALDEEMAADPSVFMMGEEVGEYQGAYKITKGLLDKYGPDRVLDTPITEVSLLKSSNHPIVAVDSYIFTLKQLCSSIYLVLLFLSRLVLQALVLVQRIKVFGQSLSS